MAEDLSTYWIALEWLRVPAYLLPAVFGLLFLISLLLLGRNRVAHIRTKQEAAAEAAKRIDGIRARLDIALQEVVSATPAGDWEPPQLDPDAQVFPKGNISPETDEDCRRLIDELGRICDVHLPELRKRALRLEEGVRDFAQLRRDVSARRDQIFGLETDIAALSQLELAAITERRAGLGWGVTFDDPMRGPLATRATVAKEAREIAEAATQVHDRLVEDIRALREGLTVTRAGTSSQ